MFHALDSILEDQLNGARQLLGRVRDALVRFGVSPEDELAMAASVRQLDELFLLVVVGEFNSGKSAFINALLGRTVLREGVTPTTARIHVLEYGDTFVTQMTEDGIQTVRAPAEVLREVRIVDTPGTNAIMREHERLTNEFVPRSDLVLFVTSADRPFTETERAFLETIRGWGKKIVIVINKADIFDGEQELHEVVEFVRDSARRLLGINPDVFPVSARLAQRAKGGEPSCWAASRFEPLERHLQHSLDEKARFRLKLSNPLGVSQALAGRYAVIADERVKLLGSDLKLLDGVERQLAIYREDLGRGFELRMAGVEKVLIEMEARGHRYFEDTLRLGRVMDLLNRARVQHDFEERVVAQAPRDVERRVRELIDWLIDEDFRQWQAVTAKLSEREREHRVHMLGAPEAGAFHSDRAQLTDSVGGEAQRVVDAYDKQREAELIAEQARGAVTTAAAAGGAAVGLGTLVTIAASTVAADVTGLLMASLLATLGFLVIPARRRRAKKDLQAKVSGLRVRLAAALRSEFERAQQRSLERLEGVIAPYGRFVKSEAERWASARRDLSNLREQTSSFLETLAEPIASER